MSVFLFLGQMVIQAVLVFVVLAVLEFTIWVFWDCIAGPSAELARENARRRAAAGVDG